MRNDHAARLFCPANLCTSLRLLLLPLVLWLLGRERFLAAFLLLALVGLSDLLDGWLARRLGTAGPFGALFDVCADCAVVFALQGWGLARGSWPAYLLALSLGSVASFGICANLRGRVSKNILGQYTGAVLLAAFLVFALARALEPELWERILQLAGPPAGAYLGSSILENLAAGRAVSSPSLPSP